MGALLVAVFALMSLPIWLGGIFLFFFIRFAIALIPFFLKLAIILLTFVLGLIGTLILAILRLFK